MAIGETFSFPKAWRVMWQRCMEELADLEVWHKEEGWVGEQAESALQYGEQYEQSVEVRHSRKNPAECFLD